MKHLFVAVLVVLMLSSIGDAAEPPFKISKMATGLEIVMMESHKVPLVTIVLCSKAGGMTETPQTNGLTHLWEHMFFKGNKRIPNQEAFNRRIRQLGIVYNGDTSAEKVRYYFTLPSAFLDEGLQFMADAISTPLLEQTELEKERRVVLDEYDRSAARPTFDLRNLTRILIYGDQDYLRDPLGHRPLIERATRTQLFKIKDEVFVPSNSAILVSGDFDPKELKKLLNKHFASWKDPKGWRPVKRPPFPQFPKSRDLIMARPNVQNASVSITMAGPKARVDPDDTFAADTLISLLSHRSGRFYAKFVDSGLSFSAGLSYYTQAQAGELTIYASTKPENAIRVRDMLLSEVREWTKADYFSQTQLADVHRSLLIGHKRSINKPSAYIKDLAFWWAVTGLDYFANYLDSLKQVDRKRVANFAKKWLIDKPRLTSILVSPEDAKRAKLKDNAGPLVQKLLTAYRFKKSS